MRVLMVNDYGGVGGAAFYVNNLSEELREDGHVVVFLSSDQYEGKKPMNTHSFSSVKGFKIQKALSRFYSEDSKEQLAKLIEEFRPDVLHLHCIWDQVTTSILDVIPDGLRVVMTLHDNSFTFKDTYGVGAIYRGYRKRLMLKLFNRVDQFISPSKFIAKELRKLGFKATVIRNCTPFKEKYVEPATKNLLYVGRVDADKGVIYAIKALEQLSIAYLGLTLTIVGDGSEMQKLKDYVKMRRLEDKVFFTGQVYNENLPMCYRESGVVLVPSVCDDNQPTTILEAMSMGRAVTASRVGGIPELVSEKTGVLVPQGDYRAIVGAVDSIIKNKKYISLGKNAYKEGKKYSVEEHVEKVVKIYNKKTLERALVEKKNLFNKVHSKFSITEEEITR